MIRIKFIKPGHGTYLLDSVGPTTREDLEKMIEDSLKNRTASVLTGDDSKVYLPPEIIQSHIIVVEEV